MVACLYGVHGNLPALEAVLADAASAAMVAALAPRGENVAAWLRAGRRVG